MLSTIAANKVVQNLVPILANNTGEGTPAAGADRQGFKDCLMIAQQGISGDTLSGSLYWTISFQESDDDSAWSNIAAADLEGGSNDHVIDAAAEDPTTIIRGYRGTKRYVRILWTATGTHTNGTPIAGVVLLGRPWRAPVTQPSELGG